MAERLQERRPKRRRSSSPDQAPPSQFKQPKKDPLDPLFLACCNLPSEFHEVSNSLLQSFRDKNRPTAAQHFVRLKAVVGAFKKTIETNLKTFCVSVSLRMAELHLMSLAPTSAEEVLRWCIHHNSPICTTYGETLFSELALLKMDISIILTACDEIIPLRKTRSWPDVLTALRSRQEKMCMIRPSIQVAGIWHFWEAEARAIQGDVAGCRTYLLKYTGALAPQASLWIEGLLYFAQADLAKAEDFFQRTCLEDMRDEGNSVLCDVEFCDQARGLYLQLQRPVVGPSDRLMSATSSLAQVPIPGVQDHLKSLNFSIHASILTKIEEQRAQSVKPEKPVTDCPRSGQQTVPNASHTPRGKCSVLTGTYYNILGVQQEAAAHDITRAYRRLSRALHPDKGGSTDDMTKLNEAYETLSNPKLRARYDQTQCI